MKQNALLLSGYDAASHEYWRKCLTQMLDEYHWTELVLSPRHFSWRMRGNSFIWATGDQREVLLRNYDVIFATSMVDLNGLFGFFPHLHRSKTFLYFHENQFAYPQSQQQTETVHHQLQSVYAAFVAQNLIFNSSYNQRTFFEGVSALLKKLPDSFPPTLVPEMEKKSCVIPVPIKICKLENNVGGETDVPGLPGILWNHRWEYDKQPDIFFNALERLLHLNYQFKIHVVGQQFRKSPVCFDAFAHKHSDIIATWGYQCAEQYRDVLMQADIVVSSALHDFQGLAIQEAMAAGCIPVTPDRVAYREYVPDAQRYKVEADNGTTDKDQEVRNLAQLLGNTIEHRSHQSSARISQLDKRFFVPAVEEAYKRLMK